MMTRASQYKLIKDISKIAGIITGDIIPVREAEGVRDLTREFRVEDVAYLTEMLGWLMPYYTRTASLYPRPNYLNIGSMAEYAKNLKWIFDQSQGASQPIAISSNVTIPENLLALHKWSETTTDTPSTLAWNLSYNLLTAISNLPISPALNPDDVANDVSNMRFCPMKSADAFRKLFKILKPLNRFYWKTPSKNVFESGVRHYIYGTDPDETEDLTGAYFDVGGYGFRAYELQFRWRSGSAQRFIETYDENFKGEITFDRSMKNVTAVVGEHVFERIADPGHAASSSTPNNNWERVFLLPLTKIGTDGLKWRLTMPANTRTQMRSRIEAVSGRSLAQYYPGTSYQLSSPSSRANPRLTAVLEYETFGYFGDLGWECDFHSLPWTGD